MKTPDPQWLHIGAGNLFRAFPAVAYQDLLDKGLARGGIAVCECHDPQLIAASCLPEPYPYVSLYADGRTETRLIGSITEAFDDWRHPMRLAELMADPRLQMVSFTITEKGYDNPRLMEKIANGLRARCQAGGPPLALLSLDNVTDNGDRLKQGVLKAAADLADYIQNQIAFPLSMIDKITPAPSQAVALRLGQEGFTRTAITQTAMGNCAAPFVNAENCQYLVVEDDFPNGRPPLEQAGILFADRATVQQCERMKVCACLNPLHTMLAIGGMVLGIQTIADCMAYPGLKAWVTHAAYHECLPMAQNPGIIDPEAFLREVLTARLPNRFLPDTPARVAADTSQKIPIRFGIHLQSRADCNGLAAIPFLFALWLKYLKGTDDRAKPITHSPDPRLGELQAKTPRQILSDTTLFGVDLYAVGLGKQVEALFEEITPPGKVAQKLEEYRRHAWTKTS